MADLNKNNHKKIILGIGSNLGDRSRFIENAIYELQIDLGLKNIKKSQIIENSAMLLPNSPKEWNQDFLNIVISADINIVQSSSSTVVFEDILKTIKNIEKRIGRIERSRWAPREIDIDILAIDNFHIAIDDKLFIPHKGLFERDFFMSGFKEIEPKLFLRIEKIFTCQKSIN